MTTPINVIIDDKTVLDDLVSVEISQTEGTYCNSVTLSLKSKTFWSLCDPTTNFGQLRIKVAIGSDTYQFLIEERDTASIEPGVDFTVWGRSEQALLAKPYSKTVNDTDDTSHPWQSGSSSASAIVSHVVSNYCDYEVQVNWNVIDFIVYEDSFSVSNQAPIEIISSLASVVGAELVANIDGSLSVEAYSVEEGASVEDYNDLDEIVSLDESIGYPPGYNAVTVYGYSNEGGNEDGNGGVSQSISAERLDDGTIYPGRSHMVRVFYYHSKGLHPISYFSDGACAAIGDGEVVITESVDLIWGKGHTSKVPNTGDSSIEGSESVPLATRTVSYAVDYIDYSVTVGNLGNFTIMFYFSDKSSYVNYNFTCVTADPALIEKANDLYTNFDTLDLNGDGLLSFAESGLGLTQEEFDALDLNGDGYLSKSELSQSIDGSSKPVCDSLVVEKHSPETVSLGSGVTIYVYGRQPTEAHASGDVNVIFKMKNVLKVTETINIVDGIGTLSKPISTSSLPQFWFSPQVKIQGPTYESGSNIIKVSSFKGEAKTYSVPCTAVYMTDVYVYYFGIPMYWLSTQFQVWFAFENCATETLDVTIDGMTPYGWALPAMEARDAPQAYYDITINVKDYISDVDVEGVAVSIDGVPQGNTDSDGLLNVPRVAVGDHTIKMTKDGYQDSDLDDLGNDTFTVG